MFAGALFCPVCLFFLYIFFLSLPCCHCLTPFIYVLSWLWDGVNWRVKYVQWPNDMPSLTRHSLLHVMTLQGFSHIPTGQTVWLYPHPLTRFNLCNSYPTSQSRHTHLLTWVNTARGIYCRVNCKCWGVIIWQMAYLTAWEVFILFWVSLTESTCYFNTKFDELIQKLN